MPSPLNGARILVTRPAKQGQQLTRKLSQLGATAIHLPAFEIRPAPLSPASLQLIENLDQFSKILFISGVFSKIPFVSGVFSKIPFVSGVFSKMPLVSGYFQKYPLYLEYFQK